MRFILSLLAVTALALPAWADNADDGTLNPDEMTLSRSFALAKEGKVNMVICSQGYIMAKKGSHEEARAIFKACIEKGYTGAMTWMSYMDTNGNGAETDPKSAAEWDRKASEAGDRIGHLNHGLNLLRGHGVDRDPVAAKKFIDKAAAAGVQEAIDVQNSGYDWNAATPDADNWRYRKNIY